VTTAFSLGVVAFGDSITNGGGELQWGVALQSWALWTARGLGLPYSPYAVDGATAADVVGCQLPAFQLTTAHPTGRYDLGCLHVGTNDVRQAGWDPQRFAGEFAATLGQLATRCNRRLVATLPLDLGRPPAGASVDEANEVIEAAAAAHGALVLDLSGFGARNLLMADHVHPTAFGQIAIAERALEVLEADGMNVCVHPSTLISYRVTRWGRLRGDATYAYRHAKVSARAALRLPRSISVTGSSRLR
jgi:lysophospholipase L1-like esterase